MNGVKYLLDTCFIIRLREQDEKAVHLISKYNVQPSECAYSDITYVEVFGWNGISQDEENYLNALLDGMPRLALNNATLDFAIQLRKNHKIKLPDALILATAKTHALTLLTLDDKLEKIYQQTIC